MSKVILYIDRNHFETDKKIIEKQIKKDPAYTGVSVLYVPSDSGSSVTQLWEPSPFSSASAAPAQPNLLNEATGD